MRNVVAGFSLRSPRRRLKPATTGTRLTGPPQMKQSQIERVTPVSRRTAIQAGALGLLGLPLLGAAAAEAGSQRRRPRIAVVYTVCHQRSHAHVILENFLTPYLFNGRLTEPTVEVVSLYADQRATGRNAPDLTDEITRRFKVPVYQRSTTPSRSAAATWRSTACSSSASTAATRPTSSACASIRASASSTKSSP